MVRARAAGWDSHNWTLAGSVNSGTVVSDGTSLCTRSRAMSSSPSSIGLTARSKGTSVTEMVTPG